METAYFAAGCFWGIEKKFSQLDGVCSTRVGYMGGVTQNPTYETVCRKKTGHAETVEIVFDPDRISFKQTLEYFFKWHDPTQKDRQGFDIGSQYRSAIFPTGNAQKLIAINYIKDLTNEKKFSREIVTNVEKCDIFWEAENYHQKYLEKRNI